MHDWLQILSFVDMLIYVLADIMQGWLFGATDGVLKTNVSDWMMARKNADMKLPPVASEKLGHTDTYICMTDYQSWAL